MTKIWTPPPRTASRSINRYRLHTNCILLNGDEHTDTHQMSKFESTLPCTFTAQYLHADTNTWYKRWCESSVHNVQSICLDSTRWHFLKTLRFSYSSWICPYNKSSQGSGITRNKFWYSVYALSIDTSASDKMNANSVLKNHDLNMRMLKQRSTLSHLNTWLTLSTSCCKHFILEG